ncbi:MAG: hypothetical protein LBO05_10935 [Deltaproteobacteria bacterium]|jgi:hypothetical protein|nr:hypothetical protein [Deltaproteobacteria bacterium]
MAKISSGNLERRNRTGKMKEVKKEKKKNVDQQEKQGRAPETPGPRARPPGGMAGQKKGKKQRPYFFFRGRYGCRARSQGRG